MHRCDYLFISVKREVEDWSEYPREEEFAKKTKLVLNTYDITIFICLFYKSVKIKRVF